MNFLQFEWTKILRQKKLLLTVLMVLLSIVAIYFTMDLTIKNKKERAIEQLDPILQHTDSLYSKLYGLREEDELSDPQAEQLEIINDMATALFHRNSSIYNEEWSKIPQHEQDIFINLQAFEQAEGTFSILKPFEKEQLIQKNNWMIDNKIAYDDELYPTTPALLIKKNSDLLLSIGGVFFLILLFGNTITKEKEQRTWLTLQSQPIGIWKIIYSKYLVSLFGLLTFIASVYGISLLVSLVLSDYSFNFQYPQLVMTGENFTFISTAEYLIRLMILFSGAALFSFSIIFLVGKFIHNSFGAIIVTGLFLSIGILLTNIFTPLQNFINPFQAFQFQEILAGIPKWTDILYPTYAIIWSLFFLVLTAVLLDKEFRLLNKKDNYNPFNFGKTKLGKSHTWIMTGFEWRKAKRSVLLKQLFVILGLFVIAGYFILEKQSNQRKEDYIEGLQVSAEMIEKEYIPMLYESLEGFQLLKQEAEAENNELHVAMYDEQEEEFEQHIQDVLEDSEQTLAAIQSIQKGDWLPLYEYQLNRNTDYLDLDSTGVISKFTIEANITEKKWLIEHNVQPVFAGDLQTTVYDYFVDYDKEAKKSYGEQYNKVDHSALFSLYVYFKDYFYAIPLVLFLFLFGAGFSNERGKKMTLNFLKTEPIGANKIILGKSIYAVFISIISGAALIAFIVFVASLFNRFGDWKYPILHYDSKDYVDTLEEYAGIRKFEGAGHFINLGDYLLSSTGLFFSILLFLIGLSIFLSLFFKRQVTVFTTTILISAIGYYISRLFLSDKAHFSPFTYLNIGEIANGERSAILNNPHLTVQTGSLILLIFALLFFVLSYVLANVKNSGKIKLYIQNKNSSHKETL